MAFKLSLYPWLHIAKYGDGVWTEYFVEKEHLSVEEESALPENEHQALLNRRNSFPELPLVNYTTQYGLGCFEGLKAYPQVGGGLKVFRPDRNAARMARSMKGLQMPSIDEVLLTKAILGVLRRNADLGFVPGYEKGWEKDHWQNGGAVYIRPFSYSEAGIGVNLSSAPWVVTVCSPVTAYFTPGSNAAVTTARIRATAGGTGWIKCSANYVIPILAKKEAMDAGFMEAIFLDASRGKFIEEGSSCNFFCLNGDGVLITPELKDIVLPGITRMSVIELARDRGIRVEERPLAVEEVLEKGRECFVTGTAAGITPLGSLTHKGRRTDFSSLDEDSLSVTLLKELKGIQYGAVEDRHGWMVPV